MSPKLPILKKHVILLPFILLYCLSLLSQESSSNNKGFSWDKVVLGGNVGASFGDYTFINLSPNLGYYLNENLIAGIGATYIYYDEPFYGSSNMYGGRIFSDYLFLENFILHAEYEVLNLEIFDRYGFSDRINIGSFLVGGGIRSNLGGRSYASLMLLYNLNESVYSPYTNPIFRVGFGIGL